VYQWNTAAIMALVINHKVSFCLNLSPEDRENDSI